MSDWDAFLTLTHPGRTLEVGAEDWLIMRRSYTRDGDLLNSVAQERMTITVELVRSGSPSDPRRPPEDRP